MPQQGIADIARFVAGSLPVKQKEGSILSPGDSRLRDGTKIITNLLPS
jgi:hypothetical protein